MNRIWVLVAALVLAGCSRSSVIDHNISLGRYSFIPADSKDFDYHVRIERGVDFGWDTANPDDRMRVIKQMLGNACPNPVIVDERFYGRGESAIGIKRGHYQIKVFCPK